MAAGSGGENAGNISIVVSVDASGVLRVTRDVADQLNAMGGAADRANEKVRNLGGGFSKLASAVKGYLTFQALKQIQSMSEEFTLLEARVTRLSASTEQGAESFKALVQIADATGASVKDTVGLWSNLTATLKNVGATNNDILRLTSTLQKIGAIGGSSTEEMANALRQFQQSIASGRVQAEEFNSIIEQMPELGRQIAEGMGIPFNELRAQMLAGKLDIKKVLEGLERQTGKINDQFEKIPRLVGPASNALINELGVAFENLDKKIGATVYLAKFIDNLTLMLQVANGSAEPLKILGQQMEDNSQKLKIAQADLERANKSGSEWAIKTAQATVTRLQGERHLMQLQVNALKDAQAIKNPGPNETPKYINNIKPTKGKGKGDAAAIRAQKEAARAAAENAQKIADMRAESQKAAQTSEELAHDKFIESAVHSLNSKATEQDKKAMADAAEATWKYQTGIKAREKAEKQAHEARVKAQKNYQSMLSQISPVAAENFKYEGEVKALEDANKQKLISVATYEEQKRAIEREHEQQRLEAMWTEWKQQSDINQMIGSSLEALQGGATNAITGLLNGTQSLSEAFANIGSTILNSVVSSLVEVGLQYVRNALIGQAMSKASTAATSAEASAVTSAWAPAAMAASIATQGKAAAIGSLSYSAAMASSSALTPVIAGAREHGGPVLGGSAYRVGEGNKPEIFKASNGNQYMIPGQNGRVISNSNLGGSAAGGIQQNITFNIQTTGGIDDATMAKMALMMKQVSINTIRDQQRPNGLLQKSR